MENLRAQHHEGLYAACMAQAVSVIGRDLSGFDVNVDTHITQRPNLYDDDTCLWEAKCSHDAYGATSDGAARISRWIWKGKRQMREVLSLSTS